MPTPKEELDRVRRDLMAQLRPIYELAYHDKEHIAVEASIRIRADQILTQIKGLVVESPDQSTPARVYTHQESALQAQRDMQAGGWRRIIKKEEG